MIYKFDDTDITAYGVLPLQSDGGIALSGMFDLPKRKGETERNWGDRIEPYTESEDLAFEGRSIGLKVVMPDADNLEEFCRACLECRLLGTELGNFRVIVKDGIQVERSGGKIVKISVNFWQDEVSFPELTLAGSGGEGYILGGYHLERDFGIQVASLKDDLDIPKRIEVNTTDHYRENCYRSSGNLTLECCLWAENLVGIAGRIGQFHALCAAPGLKLLRFPGGRQKEVYVKDGFKVKVRDEKMVEFGLKMEML